MDRGKSDTGFGCYRRWDNPPPPRVRSNLPPTDWQTKALRFVKKLTTDNRINLSFQLGLPADALDALPWLGFDPDDPSGPCFTFAEADAAGNIVGLIRRYRDGTKKAMYGSKRGLTLPTGWREHAGPLFVVEGPTDVAALLAAGLAAVGRPSNTGGVALLAELFRDLDSKRLIIVVGENDKKADGNWPGRTGAEAVARKLSIRLMRPVQCSMPPAEAKDVRGWLTDPSRDQTPWPDRGRELHTNLTAAIVRIDRPADSQLTAPPLLLNPTAERRRGAVGMNPMLITAENLIGSWLANVERGELSIRYKLATPFEALDVRPGRLILFGGAPGSGKTAALIQIGIDLLRQNESARLLVANVEMTPAMLLDRIVARIAAVPISSIADRTLKPDELSRLKMAIAALKPVAARLAFLNPPYSVEHVVAAGTDFEANVMILDYIQRFTVGDGSKDKRESLEAAINVLRRQCDAGAAVFVAAAVARQRSITGSTYQGLNLASYRGSSELEFGCDAAYNLVPNGLNVVNVQCEKNRYGAVENFVVQFDAARMTFSPAPAGPAGFDTATPAAPPKNRRPKGE